MITLFSWRMAKCWLALVATLFAVTGFAEVDVGQILTDAAMHLDASKPESFVLNGSGGVTSWINQSAAGRETYGDAMAEGDGVRTTTSWKGWDVPVYDTGVPMSKKSLLFTAIPHVQTVFWVGDFAKTGNQGTTVGKLLVSSGGTADFGTTYMRLGKDNGSAVVHIENGTLRAAYVSALDGAIVDALFDGATFVTTAKTDDFLFRRRSFGCRRNSRALSQTVFECSGQRYDPDDPRLHTACSQTWHNRLRSVDSGKLEDALLGLVRYLIRGKWFDEARICGCLAVAVDGTLQEKRRGATLSERENCRSAVETVRVSGADAAPHNWHLWG